MRWRPGTIGPRWRSVIGDQIWGALPRTWLTQFDLDARAMVDAMLSRISEQMTGQGSMGFRECDRDGIISLERIPTEQIDLRGDYRYGSTKLAEFLRGHPELDLIPTICGRLPSGRYRVLDGHHRTRACAAVGRSVLSLTGRVVRSGTGVLELQLCTGPEDHQV